MRYVPSSWNGGAAGVSTRRRSNVGTNRRPPRRATTASAGATSSSTSAFTVRPSGSRSTSTDRRSGYSYAVRRVRRPRASASTGRVARPPASVAPVVTTARVALARSPSDFAADWRRRSTGDRRIEIDVGGRSLADHDHGRRAASSAAAVSSFAVSAASPRRRSSAEICRPARRRPPPASGPLPARQTDPRRLRPDRLPEPVGDVADPERAPAAMRRWRRRRCGPPARPPVRCPARSSAAGAGTDRSAGAAGGGRCRRSDRGRRHIPAIHWRAKAVNVCAVSGVGVVGMAQRRDRGDGGDRLARGRTTTAPDRARARRCTIGPSPASRRGCRGSAPCRAGGRPSLRVGRLLGA